MRPWSPAWPLQAYLDDYLPQVAEEQEVDAELLATEFREEYASYLEGEARLAAEAEPKYLELGEEGSAEISLQLDSHNEGLAMVALAALDVPSRELLAVSDLIGLEVGPDGAIVRHF